jgi:ketosteroid isomerase-like protein
VDPEIEWVNPSDAIEPGIRRGPEGLSEALGNFRRAYKVTDLEVEQMVADGDSVVSLVNLTFVGRGSGIEVGSRQGHRFTFRDGRVVRIEWTGDPESLLPADE